MQLSTRHINRLSVENQFFVAFSSNQAIFCDSTGRSGFEINEKSSRAKSTSLFAIPPKILVVEDNEVAKKIMTDFLKTLGCQIDIAIDGHQAISMYKNGYDLIFLDIGLPGISGLGVSMAIRSQEKHSHTPIVAITANSTTVKGDCLAVGIDEVIQKPVDLIQLKNILLRWIPL